MTDPTTTPIVVHANPTQPQLEALFRQVVLAAAAVATACGSTGVAGQLNGILVFAGPIAGAIALIWGQYETWKNAKKAATMANALPNTVAQTK